MQTLLNPKASPERRGGVLLMALFCLIPVAALTVAFLQMGVSFNRQQFRRIEDENALFLAEAGLAESLAALRTGGTGAVANGITPARCGEGVFWVEATQVGNSVIALRSAGMIGSGRAALEQLVFAFGNPMYNTAIFSSIGLELPSNSFIDSFDSSLGTYDAQLLAGGGDAAGDGAVVLSNGDIVIDSSSELWGDVHSGPDWSIEVHSSSDVTGLAEPSPILQEIPPVVTPVLPTSGDYVVAGGNVATLPSGDYDFGRLEVKTGSALTISGPARIALDDFELESNTKLVLDATLGEIDFYIRDEVDMSSNSTIVTPLQAATGVSFYLVGGPSQEVSFDSNGEFYGTIYGSEATVQISSNFEVFGSVVAEEIDLASNAQIHYDEALKNAGPGTLLYVGGSWYAAGFPIPEYSRDRRDPTFLLGLQLADLPSPGDAHDL